MYGITNLYMIEDYSHYSIVKDLLRLTWCVREDAQNSTLNLNSQTASFECSTSGGSINLADSRVSDLVALAALRVALSFRKLFNHRTMVEVRGFEPLTSGLQSPRSAKLSYTPNNRLRLVAGAGFEPATFGL